jgi:hypothetical protein
MRSTRSRSVSRSALVGTFVSITSQGNDEADNRLKMVYEKLSRCQPVDRRNHRRVEPIYLRLYLDRNLLTAVAYKSNGTAPGVTLQRPCAYGLVVSSGSGLSRLDTSLRDSLNDVSVRQCHDCQMRHDDHSVDKPPPFPGNRRLAVRARIYLAVLLITPGGDIYAATLTNISSLGFRIRADYGVTLGRFLSLDVPELARYSWVAWSEGGEFGLAVANLIPQEVIKHILLIAEKDGHEDSRHSSWARGSGN